MAFYIYILSDDRNEKFIIGFTNNLVRQVHELKHMQEGVVANNKINKLIYYETHKEFEEAKRREREIVLWDDEYTKTIISLQNSKFNDLYSKIF
jgi:putative endonuclease